MVGAAALLPTPIGAACVLIAANTRAATVPATKPKPVVQGINRSGNRRVAAAPPEGSRWTRPGESCCLPAREVARLRRRLPRAAEAVTPGWPRLRLRHR